MDGYKKEERVEQHILKFSVFAALFFALLGLVWGAVSGSQMIMFDGLYSFISVVLSSLSVYVAWSMSIGADERFPVGRAQMEPMVIALKSLVITSLCLVAFIRAMISIFSGGQEINEISAMVYALIATSSCLGGLVYIIWKRKRAPGSVLVKAECMQWSMDTMLSGMVLLGFLAAWGMERTGYVRYSSYMDPVMVVVASVFFIRMPVMSLVESIRDMLHMAPEKSIYETSKKVVAEISEKRGFRDFKLRISRAGRELTYRINFLAGSPDDMRSLGELDIIRMEVENRLRTLNDNPIRLGVSFMYDQKWSR
jgi:predicted Co/Zn/Cd cation transporter (cation efflux family)